MRRVLVTGAAGFVGRALCVSLAGAGYCVRAGVRAPVAEMEGIAETAIVGNIDATTEWSAALDGVELIVHLAARVHHVAEVSARAELYEQTNSWGTRRLAEAAATAGVRRLVYLSSIKVNGEASSGRAYTAEDAPHPQGPYGISKWHAEEHLREASTRTSLEVATVRCPLVYGPGVRANFLRLLEWVHQGWPLPLGGLNNRRSMVSVWNLCDLLVPLLSHPAAPGRVWMVSDGEDRSTPELIREIGRAMRRRVRLIPVPVALLRAAGAVTGRTADIRRLCDSLQVDISQTCRELSWSPPVTLEEGLARTVAWYISARYPQAAM